MVSAHRQAWTWQDEWYGMTMTEIRRLEAETARALAMKMGQDEEVAKKAVEGGTEEAPAVPSMNFGSCLSFASESEQASMFQSIPGSDVDDEDFYDTRSVNINGEVSPGFCTTASEVADSLGSIMLYDLLSSPELANRNNEAFTKLENIQHIPDGSSLLFDVQDVFFLGSPLGLLLSLRQRIGIQSNRRVGCGFGFPSPIRPACEQVFNIFDITDPFAYRLEPLLDAAFEGVPVIRLPACGSWDSSQRRGLRRQLLMIPSTEISSKQIPASITSVLHPFLGIDFTQKTSHYATGNTMRSDWWGYQRMDLGLHCQEGGKNVISQSLPTAYYRYWESKGVSYFIVWQLVERLHRGCFSVRGDNAQCIQSGGVVLGEEHGLKLSSPFRTHSSSPSMCCTEQGVSFSNPGFFSGGGGGAGGLSRQFRSSISSRLRFKSRPPDRTKVC
ncbi:unnamed protein product [Mesocestoides corti]|uniref:Phosphatidylinositol transfer protein alpha isoform n=1 Tax=Mesocestoides corti TaxID=53468 RepID=A0A0R3UA85_MESCO|nr:unnamed protein product [Mesocestoides corti]